MIVFSIFCLLCFDFSYDLTFQTDMQKVYTGQKVDKAGLLRQSARARAA